MKSLTIVGAGLAGTLLALYMAKRGYEVEVYEARNDIRTMPDDGGRSINLALSCRGITSLAVMELMDEVKKIMVPMRARAIHELNNKIIYQPFGRSENEYINAILRSELNSLLLNKTDTYPNIKLHFNMKLSDLFLHEKTLFFQDASGNAHKVAYQHLIGADGAASIVREALKKAGVIDSRREFLKHGYKELSISRTHGVHMAREHLHLWPRDSFMLLGNPNCDDSITGSLFLPQEGEYSFATLKDEKSLLDFFKRIFPDVVDAMPNLVGEFFTHPTGNLSTVQCAPWYYRDHCLLIGDAAHGIVPFFGQGMNSAFEDCRIFNEFLEKYEDNWEKVLPEFYAARKRSTDAVAAMSMDNYQEIQHNIRDEKFNLKKQVEHELMRRYPDRYVSKHVMVMFSNIPYETAYAYGEVQAAFLNDLCKDAHTIDEIDWKMVDKEIAKYDKKLTDLKLK
ncbi:FAD-dependent monooxygenase [Legionella sp. 27cVA30]|uniref:FAD-dependent oxidoreductase n=1 Tax=Legionella sp. 27cVA30 TaxID=2905657 RepID=UPI0020A0A1D1|nr:NAD(P)/FAD-dependent oxidoreductase [Legionella sp. 27cVA30]MCP0913697.1 FAD-dependent monooxygenase [Legionella sp. 27cVA30]